MGECWRILKNALTSSQALWLDSFVPQTLTLNLGGSDMAAFPIPAQVSPVWAKGKSAAKVLSACGHPGYSSAFAAKVLVRFGAGNVSMHAAVANELAAQ